jgi:protein-tyrosine phosphatase
VDGLGGFWLAAMAIHLFPREEERVVRARNRWIAAFYAIAALLCSQLARLAWPWTFVFTWPAFSFVLAAFGYAGFGASIYRKRDGRLTFLTQMLMAPLIFGQWLSWKHYRRKSDRWNAITPNVWIGSAPTPQDASDAVAAGVTAVVDLTVEFSASPVFRSLRYHHVPVLDLTAPSAEQLAEVTQIIEEEAQKGIVYVHCKAGYSRSAGVVGAWLLTTGRVASVREAIDTMQAARKGIVIRPEIRRSLEEVARTLPAGRQAVA